MRNLGWIGRWSGSRWAGARAGLLVLAVLAFAPGAASAAEQASTKDRKEQEKQQRKKDQEFNREIQFRRVVGPDVLPLGPYSVSLFVQGEPVEGRVRVAIQAKTVADKLTLEAQKWAINGILYPLTVRMFERGRPTTQDILSFKTTARERLLKRYPDMIDDVYIESLI